jgi:hypothetical protein
MCWQPIDTLPARSLQSRARAEPGLAADFCFPVRIERINVLDVGTAKGDDLCEHMHEGAEGK